MPIVLLAVGRSHLLEGALACLVGDRFKIVSAHVNYVLQLLKEAAVGHAAVIFDVTIIDPPLEYAIKQAYAIVPEVPLIVVYPGNQGQPALATETQGLCTLIAFGDLKTELGIKLELTGAVTR